MTLNLTNYITLNLTNYIGQTITVRLRNGDVITSTVNENYGNPYYEVSFHNQTYTNKGLLYFNSEGIWDIVEVISSNSNSSNNTNTMNEVPQNIDEFITLLTAVRNEYGNLAVQYARNTSEAASDDCRCNFEDIVVVGGTKSLIRSSDEQIDSPGLVFITY